ncbi:hypothetical protein HNP37_004460 [Flavobacterium nitrogenifigens]|uniref:Uncharacterized protein n=2 Tax=Flavobacterium TaxID=237 RepID=A0A7W7J1W9_9FLAO|nr:hypothetical protein [Flavobacterium nitrogenifigens]MBB6389231.1 hypothetical protein [Flavobacterium notoginsengisoli]
MIFLREKNRNTLLFRINLVLNVDCQYFVMERIVKKFKIKKK